MINLNEVFLLLDLIAIEVRFMVIILARIIQDQALCQGQTIKRNNIITPM